MAGGTTTARRMTALLGAAAVLMALSLRVSRAEAPVFAEPVALPGGAVTEPGIDIAADGTVFVNGIQGLPSHSKLWRSTDGASSFQAISFSTPYNRFPGGGDADVAIGDDGRIYFLDLSALSNSIARSEDHGESWIEGSPFTTLPLSDRQWIAVGPRDPSTRRDTLYVVYHLIQPPQSIMFARSRDAGLTWDWHTAPAGLGGALPGQIVADGDFVAFNYESQGTMYLVRSINGGTSWTRHQVTLTQEVSQNLTAVALDGDAMYIAWINRHDHSVRVARSTDRGVTWPLDQIRTVSAGGTAMFPWVAARDGKVAVAWYGADGVTGNPNTVPASTAWRVKYVEAVGWDDGFGSPVEASHGVVKHGIICTAGLSCANGRELGDFLQVAIDPQGKALISYVDLVCDPFCKGANVVKQR